MRLWCTTAKGHARRSSRPTASSGHSAPTSFFNEGECSYLALAQALASGRQRIIKLGGDEFYRNTAIIQRVG